MFRLIFSKRQYFLLLFQIVKCNSILVLLNLISYLVMVMIEVLLIC